MKKVLFLFSAISMLSFSSCKDNAADKVKAENVEVAAQRDAQKAKFAQITFDETEFDFGTIDQGTNVEHVFTFSNSGDVPLVITDANSTCGCTVPSYTDKPIAPGEKGELLVKFNGSGQNQVTKTISVIANTESGKEQIKIKAFVTPTESKS